MHGAWGGAVIPGTQDFDEGDDVSTSTSEDDSEDEALSPVSPLSAESGEEGEERGRKMEKGEGSVNRMEHPEPKDIPGSPKNHNGRTGGDGVAENPFVDQETDKEAKELDKIVQELEADGELLKIDLDDVQEGNEDEIPIDATEKQE